MGPIVAQRLSRYVQEAGYLRLTDAQRRVRIQDQLNNIEAFSRRKAGQKEPARAKELKEQKRPLFQRLLRQEQRGGGR